jgi:uncharacterized protein (DUF885 family)
MRKRLILSCFISFSAVLSAAPAFDAWVDRFTVEWMRLDPQAATTAQFFSGAEQDALDRELRPATAEYRAKRAELARLGRNELRRQQSHELTADQRVSAAMLDWLLEDFVARHEFRDHDFVFEQFRGLQVALVNFLSQTHPIRSARDVENYLARLGQVAQRLDEGIVEARSAAERGFLPPRFIVERSLQQTGTFLERPARENVLVASLDERARALADLPASAREAFVSEAERVVRDEVLPAFRRVQALLQEQLPLTNDHAGIWRLPRGDEAYTRALITNTTTRLTPEEIHAIGLREVARLENEMDKILGQLGYTEGTVEARFTVLNDSVQPPAEPDPRPALIAEYTRIVREAEARAAEVFDLRPRAPVEVRREPSFTERTAAARYSLPAPDGSRPGVFWAPLPGPKFNILRMRSLAYHEAIPGHHFQLALLQEMEILPRFRRDLCFGTLSAHTEGWALYAERLADELGWYEGDPHGRLGYLSSELFRARRLVVDTGLHAKRWTRQQAIDYGISAQEVERYVVWPGQACSYLIGQLHLLDLRERAKAALGKRFSLREFHNVVLRTGAVPLNVLTQVIDDWIDQQRT